MQYKCILPTGKKGLFNFLFKHSYQVDDIITTEQYEGLPGGNKDHFVTDYSDESIADQIERNIETDKD